jgi:hypothetical protein
MQGSSMARFSIVVPVEGKNSSFEETLASALRYRPDNTQVIVPHCGAYEDSYGLGKEVDFIPVRSKSENSLIEQFNAGVKAARGSIIGFLRPGIEFTENWDEPVEAGFSSMEVACVSPVIISASDPNRIITTGIRAGGGFSRELVGVDQPRRSPVSSGSRALGPTSWGAFYRRSFLVSLDECDLHLGANYFDLDLALSFAALGLGSVEAHNCVLTCAASESHEMLQEAFSLHGCSAERAMARFGGLVETTAPPAMMGAFVKDLLCWPWKWQNLAQRRQRKFASKFKLLDQHYRGLLQLLHEQRSRLVSPGLHSRVAAKQRINSIGRKAA